MLNFLVGLLLTIGTLYDSLSKVIDGFAKQIADDVDIKNNSKIGQSSKTKLQYELRRRRRRKTKKQHTYETCMLPILLITIRIGIEVSPKHPLSRLNS